MSEVVLDFEFMEASLPKLQVDPRARKTFPSEAAEELARKGVLNYDYYVQNTGYWCGPTTVQMILKARSVTASQSALATRLRTTTNGTDYIGQFPPVLNSFLPAAKYFHKDSPKKDALWNYVVDSIDAGYGVAANIVARSYNKPPGYPGYDVWHYVPVFGYGTKGSTKRIFCGDSANFSGVKSWWASLDQMTSLVSEKGIAPASAGKPKNFLGATDEEIQQLKANFNQLGPS
ncbi:endolysin [Gordonia phage GMA2]|uniref:Putative peptidase n=1 Tax=Gordonia phage GMA2 TaxID=1647283 RepID=A0A0K0N745_9CAUD|nr:endolysin [Gordonia phage GMA2]AKJ72573.1 putative peptidase [Gordonia phage GMA2]